MLFMKSIFRAKGVRIVKGLEKILLLLLLLVGCALMPIQTYKVIDYNSLPKTTATIYAFASGRLKAAFLENPGSEVKVFPYSSQIVKTSGTVEDAMAFMRDGVYADVDVQSVERGGKTLGYLFIYKDRGIATGPSYLQADFFEQNEKIYFDVTIKEYGQGGGGRISPEPK
jgi:hypothetical protein